MKRRHPCDCCGRERRRWQRLCGFCFTHLPQDIRAGIVGNWRLGDKRAWRAAVREGLDHFSGAIERHRRNTATMVGEREA